MRDHRIAPCSRRRKPRRIAVCLVLTTSMLAAACSSNEAVDSSLSAPGSTSTSGVDTSGAAASPASSASPTADTTPGTTTADVATTTAASDPPSQSSAPDPEPIEPLPAEVADAMTSAGIAVVAAPEPVESDAILTLTDSQAQFMAEEAAAGGGFLGSDLDAAGGGATQGLPMVAVLAGYVRGVDTPGAEYARTLLTGQDLTHPETVVFPTIVLALFASDAASAFAADEAGVSGVRAGFHPGAGTREHVRVGICSDVTKTIFNAIEKIFAKIHIPPARVGDTGSKFLNGVLQGLTDVVITGLNFVIDAAKRLIIEGVEFILGKVLSIVAEVAAGAALVANFVSAVRPWRLDVTAKDVVTRKGVDAEQVYDQATAKAIIVGPTDDWPGWFYDCAAVAGVKLPSLLPIDAPVTWRVEPFVPALMSESTAEIPKDTKLRKEGDEIIAKIGLVTATESKEVAEKGAEQRGGVLVAATARRTQIEELRTTLVTAATNLAANLLGAVPSVIKNFLVDLVKQAAEGGSEQIASLLDSTGKVLIEVVYHGPPEPEQTSPPTGDAWSLAFYSQGSVAPTFAGYSCSGLVGTWHMIFAPGSPLERTYELPFSAAATTVHHDLIYDLPPDGNSPALHLEWRWDYFLDTSVTPPMIRITGTQHETPEGGSEAVFDNNFGTGEGLVLENMSLPKLLEGRGLSHPFLTQAAAECA